MENWEEFSAFGDIAELERVCEIILEEAAIAAESRMDGPDYMTGRNSHLRKRLHIQAEATERILEQRRPGLYPRTWMAHLFNEVFRALDTVTDAPGTLNTSAATIVLSLHKVLIAAMDVYDGERLERLIASATKAKTEAVREAPKVMGAKGGSKAKRSQGIELAIRRRLTDGKGGMAQTAGQLWAYLARKKEEDPFKVDGYEVYLDCGDDTGKHRLRSKKNDGTSDGRGVTRSSFSGVVTRVRTSIKNADSSA
ncbi:MAG: hypothetical protein AB1899_05315 [Pseudomonadota bacterium]